jgi:hypothetical protein
MSTSKHPLSGQTPNPPLRDDLEDNPGIGASRGTTIAGEDPHILTEDGTNTEEGDVGNDADATGAPRPNAAHRTNK